MDYYTDDLRVTVYDDDIRVVVDAAIALNGKDGVGAIPGGAEGQLLAKKSSVDYDTEWVSPQVPAGGDPDQVLTKKTTGSFDTEWRDVPPGVPAGGTTGQVLTKASGTPYDAAWSTQPTVTDRVLRAGDTMEGSLILDDDPIHPLGAATKQTVDLKAPIADPLFTGQPRGPTPPAGHSGLWLANTEFVQERVATTSALRVLKTGDTMTGALVLPAAAPTLPEHAANKAYVDTRAPLDSPVLTGTPTAPTPTAGDNDNSVATTEFVQNAITASITTGNFVDKAGDTMDGPLVLSGDPSVATGAATKQMVDLKAPLESPIFTGNPTAPTPSAGDNDTSVATTEYVQSEFTLKLPLYLPKVGGTMTGPIVLPTANPTIDEHAAHKKYVDSKIGGAYQLEVDTILRTDKDRWNDHLNVAEIAPIDPTGAASTFDVALLGAWNKALSRGRRSVIHLPAGNFRLGAVLELLNDYLANSDNIEIVGAGMYATAIISPAVSHDVFRIGSNAAGVIQSGNIVFRDLTISAVGTHTGALVGIRNTNNVYFINVRFNLGFKGLTFEEETDNPSLIKDKKCASFFLIDCRGSVRSGGILIHPTAVEALSIQGGRWGGGAGRRFFVHDYPTRNCDGVYIHGGHFDQFDINVDSTGAGLVNVEIQAEQFDRSPIFIRAQPPAGVTGLNRNWIIHNTQFQGGSLCDDVIVWDASLGTVSSVCEGLNVTGCNFHRIKKRILYSPKGSGVMMGITARSCGNTGTEIIRLGTEGNFELVGIQGHRGALDTSDGYPTHGIIYDGPSTGKRGHTACRFWDATVAPFAGTP